MGLTTGPRPGRVGGVKSQTGIGTRHASEPCGASATMTGMTSPNVPTFLGLPGLAPETLAVLGGGSFADSGPLFATDAARSATMEFEISDPRTMAVLAGQYTTWHLAICHRCNDDTDNGQPFSDDIERDSWAVAHVTATGHVVQVTTETTWTWDGEHGKVTAGEHETAMLRFGDAGWHFLCTTTGCERWNGRYDSGQLALASFRGHTAKATR